MFMERDKSSSEDGEIQTKDISDWLECTVRMIQKWCLKEDIPFHRIKGIKHYIWNDETLEKFGKWYNHKLDRPKKSYYVPKPKREPKPKSKPIKEKKTVTFTTVKDILDEVTLYDKYDRPRQDSTKFRYIQRWCKRHKIPSEYVNGRKYYVITKETKRKIIDTFGKPGYLYHLFTKEDYEKKKNRVRDYSHGLHGTTIEYNPDIR